MFSAIFFRSVDCINLKQKKTDLNFDIFPKVSVCLCTRKQVADLAVIEISKATVCVLIHASKMLKLRHTSLVEVNKNWAVDALDT